ncbi:phage holin family protein [Tumidithrix helvetica PCC 7403]|uniref:phage holin family protein n=1 Tax=Tumidithrix helvetica TaxID=3457545 RepID=UPI003CB96652
MLGYFFTILATALSLLVVDIIVPGVDIANFPSAMLAAIVIGLVNSSIRPVLSVLSLPLTFLTLGAFSLVINGFCLWLASILVPGFSMNGLLAFILAPVILSFASTFLNKYFAERGTEKSNSTKS